MLGLEPTSGNLIAWADRTGAVIPLVQEYNCNLAFDFIGSYTNRSTMSQDNIK
jgi:hypothetical protein